MTAPAAPQAVFGAVEQWLAALDDHGLATGDAASRLRAALRQSHGEGLDMADDAVLVAMICGPTAVGKSSLINAIAGSEISPPGTGAATRGAVIYLHRDDDPARLFEYSEALGQLARAAPNVVRHSREELLRKILVDTPDIDSVMLGHHALTDALIHCADVALFVTSPEKYKDLRSARWVAGQRRQRAMAFVLNKWDRSSIGVQFDRRAAIEGDFRAVLAAEGFADPLVFKTSTLRGAATVDGENDLPALRRWLSQSLDRAAATAIQDRRKRAAWGRLSAAIAPVVPASFRDHPALAAASARLADSAAQGKRMVRLEASALAASGPDDAGRPFSRGLLGLCLGIARWAGGAASLLRRVGRRRKADGGRQRATGDGAAAFGRPAERLLARTTARLAGDAAEAGLPLGTTPRTWTALAAEFGQECAGAPATVENELADAARRLSPRRILGTILLLAVELSLWSIVALALWRVGWGFIDADYAQGAMLLDAAALFVSLGFVGAVVTRFFFPPLRERLVRRVAHRAEALVERTWRRAEAALLEQVEALEDLRRRGRQLLAVIDALVATPTAAADAGRADAGRADAGRADAGRADVVRLFGDAAPAAVDRQPAAIAGHPAPPPARRPPVFD